MGIRRRMAKDRRHAASSLKKATNALYATLAKNAEAQSRANKRLQAATALRRAKAGFAARLAKMHATAVRVAKKQEKKINKLAGIVTANAVKDAKGRALLRSMQQANK